MDAETRGAKVFVAFEGSRRLAVGGWAEVTAAARAVGAGNGAALLVFDDETGEQVDLDPVLPGQPDAPASAVEAGEVPEDAGGGEVRSGPGRPRLGVVCREVSLLPRHWDWLAAQPGGASVTLRRLVEAARRDGVEAERRRRARDAAHRFLWTMAGDLPGFEEASRAFYAGDLAGFTRWSAPWPPDVRAQALRMVGRACPSAPGPGDGAGR